LTASAVSLVPFPVVALALSALLGTPVTPARGGDRQSSRSASTSAPWPPSASDDRGSRAFAWGMMPLPSVGDTG
jgi:hypothetical protein